MSNCCEFCDREFDSLGIENGRFCSIGCREAYSEQQRKIQKKNEEIREQERAEYNAWYNSLSKSQQRAHNFGVLRSIIGMILYTPVLLLGWWGLVSFLTKIGGWVLGVVAVLGAFILFLYSECIVSEICHCKKIKSVKNFIICIVVPFVVFVLYFVFPIIGITYFEKYFV